MAAVAEVTITPGTGKFDPEDQRWADQVTLLADDLREAAGSVSRRRIPEPGVKGAVGEVILALGSAGAVTAAVVECFRNATFPRDPHGLAELEGPLADIKVLRQALTDPEVGLFDPGDVVMLDDRSVQQSRRSLPPCHRRAGGDPMGRQTAPTQGQ
ncbi:MAG: hypothetical protein ACRDRI_25865 [Pseudonocardiaceae bacterium]